MMKNEIGEPEDFQKKTSFKSGEFAIVDAEIVKSLKDDVSLDNVIFVPTKQSVENPSDFKIVAEYDDATLRRLVIEPAFSDDPETEVDLAEAQLAGHGGDTVQQTIGRINRIGGDRPKSANRSERNKRYSAKGDPKVNMSGRDRIQARIDQKVSLDGAQRDNYGRPQAEKSEVEVECLDLLAKAKEDLLTEEYLNSLKHGREIRSVLASIRDNDLVSGKSFDLVYEAVQKLDAHWHETACKWVEGIVKKGFLDV